jgi:hypothetical protein
MIIGICGFEGAGKDTVANYLVENYGFTKLSFAAVLKDIAAVLFDWPRAMLEGDSAESREWREVEDGWWAEKLGIPGFTPRLALQRLGTDVFRNHFHSDIWLIALERRLQKYKNVVVSDCRFPNELTMIQRLGGQVWRVDKKEKPVWYDDYVYRQIVPSVHPSCYMWIQSTYNLVLMNVGTLDHLYTHIKKYVDDNLSTLNV